jgi:hypothetical protein
MHGAIHTRVFEAVRDQAGDCVDIMLSERLRPGFFGLQQCIFGLGLGRWARSG